MALLTTSADIKDDALFRAGEPTDGTSEYDDKALDWLNRAYRAIWMGGTEFDSDLNEEWWWLKGAGNLILQPTISSGTVSVTENSENITFSAAPSSSSLAGWFFKVAGESDVYQVSTHNAGGVQMALDSVFTGETDTAATYTLMKLQYDLASDVLRLIAPMRQARQSDWRVFSISKERMLTEFPLNLIQTGTPTYFFPVDEDTVQFNRAGDGNGNYIRLDYDYLKKPDDLADDTAEPLVPIQYRYLLADSLLFWLMMDKEDSRTDAQGLVVRAGLRAMKRENERRWAEMADEHFARIYPRAADREHANLRGVLRTETGVIIG